MRRFSFLIALSLFVLISFGARAAGTPPKPEELIRRIESRRGSWTGLKTGVFMRFISPEKKEGSCNGTLVYNRLDEKILLQCFNASGQKLFAFRTHDREFSLDLPARKMLVHGVIFDLEDSPEIESHLRALDLYRALKPMAVPTQEVAAESLDGGNILKVYRNKTLVRKIRLNAENDPVMELYYHPVSGKPWVSIHRSEYHNLEGYFLPYRVLIKSNRDNPPGLAETVLEFKNPSFVPDLSDSEFNYAPEAGTAVVELEGGRTA